MFFNHQQAAMDPKSMMLQASLGAYLAKALSTVAQLNIADLLVEGAKTADELAEATETHAPSLYRLLRFLSSLDVFERNERQQFALTPLSATLRTDNPYSPGNWITFSNQPWRWELIQATTDVVATGQSAYQHIYNEEVYTVFTERPEFGRTFNQAMKSWSSSLPGAVVNAYDFSNVKTVVDLGGGMGDLLAAILHAHPTMRGILFDQPHVISESKKSLERHGVADRCQVVGGDFLTAVPEGGDLYIISYVLMDWSDEDCIKILKNCHRAMKPGSKLLAIEPVVDSRRGQTLAYFVDLIMLLETSGQIRNEQEWKHLLKAANFNLANIIPTEALSMDILELTRTSDSISLLSNQPDRQEFPNSVTISQSDRSLRLRYSKPLGVYLVEAGLIAPEQVNVALNEQQQTGQRFGEVLSSKGWVKQETIEYMMDKVVLPERQSSTVGVKLGNG